jgi:actin cytoskeleton-regulatory complex protein PAN1
MAERLAALGIKAPVKSGETPQQKIEREKKEQDDRLRKAEEEDSRREQERQRRLADESIAPPTVGKAAAKKPPPPPSRKGKGEVATPDKHAEFEGQERAIRQEQDAQEAERKRLE